MCLEDWEVLLTFNTTRNQWVHTHTHLLIHTRYKLFLGVFKITRVVREKSDHTFGSTIKKANPDSIQINLIQRLYKLKLFL